MKLTRPKHSAGASALDAFIDHEREADVGEVDADVSYERIDLSSAISQPEVTALLPEATARALIAIPVDLEGDIVVVAVAHPSRAVLDRLRQELARPVRPVVADQGDVLKAIDRLYRALSGVDSEVLAFEARDVLRKEAERLEHVNVNDEAPVVRVVHLCITQGLRDRASDIHFEPSDGRIRVRFRIDGALHDVLSLPGSMGPALTSRLKILADLNIVERRRPQDGQISMLVEGRDVDIRVATTPVVGGEKVVLRLLDKSRPLFQLGQLGMSEDIAGRFRDLLHTPYGMVMCAGPTGSGKTTTLYSSLGEINSPERNIMTIEDPVEYTLATVNQIQINEQAGVTFATGLRSILRQDPDVILVGEVRDAETARIAVQSALTGHLVLSSLHATDSVAALLRLLDMGIESFLVASSVTAVVAQRLVRRTCTYCRTSYTPSVEELAYLDSFGGERPPDGFSRGAGCNFCSQTGYLDRVGVYELLVVSDEVRELVVDRRSHDDVRKAAIAQGMSTLQDQAVRLVASGLSTPAEVMRSIYLTGA